MNKAAAATKPCEMCGKPLPHWRVRNGESVCSTQCWQAARRMAEGFDDAVESPTAKLTTTSLLVGGKSVNVALPTEPITTAELVGLVEAEMGTRDAYTREGQETCEEMAARLGVPCAFCSDRHIADAEAHGMRSENAALMEEVERLKRVYDQDFMRRDAQATIDTPAAADALRSLGYDVIATHPVPAGLMLVVRV